MKKNEGENGKAQNKNYIIVTKGEESGKVRSEQYKTLLKVSGKWKEDETTGWSQWEVGSLVTSE